MKKIILAIFIIVMLFLAVRDTFSAKQRFWVHSVDNSAWQVLDDTEKNVTCYGYQPRNSMDCVQFTK